MPTSTQGAKFGFFVYRVFMLLDKVIQQWDLQLYVACEPRRAKRFSDLLTDPEDFRPVAIKQQIACQSNGPAKGFSLCFCPLMC